MFTNLLKAAVAVTLTPAAVVVDIVKLPITSSDHRKGMFDTTENMLDSVGKNVKRALED